MRRQTDATGSKKGLVTSQPSVLENKRGAPECRGPGDTPATAGIEVPGTLHGQGTW
jgi:hypothetical protein